MPVSWLETAQLTSGAVLSIRVPEDFVGTSRKWTSLLGETRHHWMTWWTDCTQRCIIYSEGHMAGIKDVFERMCRDTKVIAHFAAVASISPATVIAKAR